MKTIPCKAILFDMDGTLVDSTACVEAFWREWAVQHGVDADELLAVSHGYRTADTIRLVAPHLDADREAAAIEAEEIHAHEGIVAIAGAAALIASVPEDRWAVVTSATRELAVARLGFAGLPVPRVLIGSGDVERGKPHPEGFLKAAEMLGVAAEDCLVIEDTPAGLKAGHAAGAQVLGISTTYPVEVLPAEICVADLLGVRFVGNAVEVEV